SFTRVKHGAEAAARVRGPAGWRGAGGHPRTLAALTRPWDGYRGRPAVGGGASDRLGRAGAGHRCWRGTGVTAWVRRTRSAHRFRWGVPAGGPERGTGVPGVRP